MALQVAASFAITANANHPSVKKFRGFALRPSVTAQVRFRDTTVGGNVFWKVDAPAGTTTSLQFPEPFNSPGGVYVEVVAGTLVADDLLVNGT